MFPNYKLYFFTFISYFTDVICSIQFTNSNKVILKFFCMLMYCANKLKVLHILNVN